MLRQREVWSLRQLLRLGKALREARLSSAAVQPHASPCTCMSCTVQLAQARNFASQDSSPGNAEIAPSTSRSIHEGETACKQWQVSNYIHQAWLLGTMLSDLKAGSRSGAGHKTQNIDCCML